jgi:hypothetical protein
MSQDDIGLEIQLREVPIGTTSLGLGDWFDPAVHHYVALVKVTYDALGNRISEVPIQEIHGLATRASRPADDYRSPEVQMLETGTWSNLYAYSEDHVMLKNGRVNQVLASTGPVGRDSAEYHEFQRDFEGIVNDAKAMLNGMNLRYHVTFQNSNTVARWVADRVRDVLGLEEAVNPGFRLRRPGWGNTLTDPTTEREVPRGTPFPSRFRNMATSKTPTISTQFLPGFRGE